MLSHVGGVEPRALRGEITPLGWRALIPTTPVILVTALLFFWVTGNGVLFGGMNPDDWRQIGRVPAEWGGPHGRWAMDLIYRYPLGRRYMEPLQLILVYACFLYIAATLARAVVDERFVSVATVGIFLAGVNHPYMTDVLNFSSHIFGYPFALVLSLAAFSMVPWLFRSNRAAMAAVVLGAGQLLALSLALYPSFVLFGLLVPAVALMRTDRTTDRDAMRIVVGALIIGLAGVAIFLVEWRAFQLFSSFYTARELEAVERYDLGAPTWSVLSAKIAGLGGFLRSVYGGAIQAPSAADTFFQAFAVLIAAAWGLATALDVRSASTPSAKALSLVRRTLGIVGAAIVIPALFWFTYTEFFAPPRTFAKVGFTTPAMLLACASSIRAQLPAQWGDRVLLWIGMVPALALATVSLFISAAMWNDQQRTAERDAALASAIYGRLSALPNFDGESFVLVGDLSDPRLRWSSSIGWSMTDYMSDPHMIFNHLLGFQGRVDRVMRSPRPCRAFPASDATFVHDGRIFVCLKDDVGVFPLGPCEAVSAMPALQVCRSSPRRAFIKSASDCNGQRGRRFFSRFGEGEKVSTQMFEYFEREPSYRDFTRDVCFYEVSSDVSPLSAVGEVSRDGRTVWLKTMGAASK